MFSVFVVAVTSISLEIESCQDLKAAYVNHKCCSSPFSTLNATRSQEDIIDTLQFTLDSDVQMSRLSEEVQRASNEDYWNSIEVDLLDDEEDETFRRLSEEPTDELIASVQIRTESEERFNTSRSLVICLVDQIKQNTIHPFENCVNHTQGSFQHVVSVHSTGHTHKYWKNWRKRLPCRNRTTAVSVPNEIHNQTKPRRQYGCSIDRQKTCCTWEPMYSWMWWWSKKSCRLRSKYRCIDYAVPFANESLHRCRFANKV